MLRESFTEKKTGTLQKLTGEYQSRYGLIHYETYSFTPDPLGDEYRNSPKRPSEPSHARAWHWRASANSATEYQTPTS